MSNDAQTARETQPLVKPSALPMEPVELAKDSTSTVAFINTLKAFMGAGILSMPYGFQQAGYLGALVVLLVVAVMSHYMCTLLLRCRATLAKRMQDEGQPLLEEITYPDIGAAALPEWHLGERISAFCLLLCQLGACIAYLIFIGNNMHRIAPDLGPRSVPLLLIAPALLAMCYVRRVDLLFPTSLLGSVLFFVGLALLSVHGFSNWHPPAHMHAVRWDTMPIFLGMAIFAMEGINMILPVEQSMRNPSQFPRVLTSVYVCIFVVYVLFGLLGWAFFGDETASVITLNFPSNFLGMSARMCLCLYLFCTYPVVLFPVSQLFDHWAHHKLQEGAREWLGNPYAIRTVLVCFTLVMAMCIRNFGPFLSLIGYLGFGVLGFMAPALFYLRLHTNALSTWDLLMCWTFILIGAVALVVGSTLSAIELLQGGEQ